MSDATQSPITTVGTKLVYESRWMKVREDAILRQDGSQGIYGVVEKPNFAVIVPVEADGSIHLVEQFRYPVGARFWELPQGSWEHAPDSDPLEVARGELREETGLVADHMTYAGNLFPAYGHAVQRYHIFLARDLSQTAAEPEHEEQDLISRRFPGTTVAQMIRDGEIKDGTTVAAFGLLHLKGLLRL